jgi:CRP-like cAMP-binding protein
MYAIRSGEVVIEKAGHVVAIPGRGSLFGEMALIDGSPRNATARTKIDCEVTVIGQETFLFLISRDAVLRNGSNAQTRTRAAACERSVTRFALS